SLLRNRANAAGAQPAGGKSKDQRMPLRVATPCVQPLQASEPTKRPGNRPTKRVAVVVQRASVHYRLHSLLGLHAVTCFPTHGGAAPPVSPTWPGTPTNCVPFNMT
ncbi:MAG: hypothetical protein AB1791_14275, partial [Chloroflexota bacterium]